MLEGHRATLLVFEPTGTEVRSDMGAGRLDLGIPFKLYAINCLIALAQKKGGPELS